MDAVDGHMRSKHSNQQGGGEGGVRGSVVRMAPMTLEGWMAKNGYGFYVPTSYTNLGTYLSYENNGEIANLDLNKVSV